MFNYLDAHDNLTIVAKAILRTYGGIFDHVTKINLGLISNKVGQNEASINKNLNKLEKDGIISLEQTKTDASISFLVPREDDGTINRISKIIKQQNDLKTQQVNSVLEYTKNDLQCKSQQLLAYFGEKSSDVCGICSVCIQNHIIKSETVLTVAQNIETLLKTKALNSRAITKQLQHSELEINKALKLLLEHRKIEISANNLYHIKQL